MEIISGNKNYFKLLPAILLVYIGCDTVSDNLKDEPKLLIKISIIDLFRSMRQFHGLK